jgi:hypothetical protein
MVTMQRLYTLEDGRSVVADLIPPFPILPSGLRNMSSPVSARSMQVGRISPGYESDWHNTLEGEPTLVVFLGPGTVQLEISGEQYYRFGAGDVLLASDFTGQGHRTAIIGGDQAMVIYVTLQNGSERLF